MRKITSLLLVVVLVFSTMLLTSCENAQSLITKATEKTQKLDSYKAELEMEVVTSAQGMTLEIPMTIDMKVKGAQTDSPVVSATIAMSMFGQTFDIDMYAEDEWIYMSSNGENVKMSADDADGEYDYTDDIQSMIKDLPKDVLKDAEIVKNDDGSKTVALDLASDVFEDVYDDLIKSVNDSSDTEASNVEISDAKVKITVADGYISVYDISFDMDITVSEIETSSSVKCTVTFKDPGKDVEIAPPEGYKNFKEA